MIPDPPDRVTLAPIILVVGAVLSYVALGNPRLLAFLTTAGAVIPLLLVIVALACAPWRK